MKVGIPTEETRAVLLAKYIIKNKATVRETAYAFSVSKSTVHKDVTSRLKEYNMPLFLKVNEVLQTNKALRHLRGGEATKKKYSKERGKNKCRT